jgi:benzoylformate decarboxylase
MQRARRSFTDWRAAWRSRSTASTAVKEFGKWEHTFGVPGLDLPGLDIVATAASYGLDAHEAHTADEVTQLVKDGIADRQRPTLINARILPVNV